MLIKINHISKTEGHSGFEGAILSGDIAQARIEAQEGARLIEGLLRGRLYFEAPIITSRICGICPVVHNLTSIRALEAALGISVGRTISLWRKLMLAAQIVHSHALHLFFLSLPDFVRSSDFSLIKKYPKPAAQTLKIRQYATELLRIIGGRTVHPINSEVGGFKRQISRRAFEAVLQPQEEILEAAISLANFFSRLDYPKFKRETEYVCLESEDEYAIIGDFISVSSRDFLKPERFLDFIEEQEADVVKRTKFEGGDYLVGALARLNNNHKFLNREAKKLFQKKGLKTPINNCFYNVFAQAIEMVHFVEEIGRIWLEIKERRDGFNLEQKKPAVKIRPGKGLAASEAPRGTLFHYYEVDKQGRIMACNIITPTAQFLNNLEADLTSYIPKTRQLGDKERKHRLKQLIRAYDPCFTCAVH